MLIDSYGNDVIEYSYDLETINGLNLYAYCGNNPVMFTDPNGTNFLNDIRNFFNRIGNWINKNILKPIGDFFSGTVYEKVLKPAWDWVANTALPAIGNFFTKTVPNFFVNTLWNKGLVPAWNYTKDFFVNTFWNDWLVNKIWSQFIVQTIWKGGILPAWNWLKDNWKNVVDWITAIAGLVTMVVGVVAYFVTLPVSLTITSFIIGGLSTIWGSGRVFKWW